jgi:hypothetical protein
VERTHLLKHDLDWVPRSYRILRAVVGVGASLAGAGAWTAVAFTHGHVHPLFLGTMGAMMAPFGLQIGDRAVRAVIARRLRRLARGEAEVAHLHDQEDGELVHVRGTVRAQTTIRALLDDAPAVFRRVIFSLRPRTSPREGINAVHEAAVDFALVDSSGVAIIVEVEGARLLAEPKNEREMCEETRFLALRLPPELSEVADRRRARAAKGNVSPVPASEVLLREGDEVEVVGYKSRRVDPTVAKLARETPMRASLRSGKQLPLLILPVGTSA